MKKKRLAILGLFFVLILFLVLIPKTVLAASQYVPEEEGTIYAQVLGGDGSPINDATVTLTLWTSAGVKVIDGVSMTYIAETQGLYKYDFTAPATEGVYAAEVVTANPTGYGSTEIHITEAAAGGGASASDIWEEDLTVYTDPDTAGGMISNALGGNIMRLILFGIMALALLALFFWKKSQVAAYGAAGAWLLLGIQAYVVSDSPNPAQIQDTYMGLFWLGVVFTIACIFLPLIMREKPSKDDIFVDEIDEVTGEPIKHESEVERQAREARKERRHQSPEQKALNRLNRTGKL